MLTSSLSNDEQYIRVGTDQKEKIIFIDYPGGPMLSVGDVYEFGICGLWKIKSISLDKNKDSQNNKNFTSSNFIFKIKKITK